MYIFHFILWPTLSKCLHRLLTWIEVLFGVCCFLFIFAWISNCACTFSIFVKVPVTKSIGYLWKVLFLDFILFHCSIWLPCHQYHSLGYVLCSMFYKFWHQRMRPPVFFSKLFWLFYFLSFHVNFKFSLSISTKSSAEIFIQRVNLYTELTSFIECSNSWALNFYLLRSFKISFLSV